MLLELLANGRIGEFRDLSAIAPDALVHLEGYELIDTQAEVIRLEALQTFLQARSREVQAAAGADSRRFDQGSVFEGYTILKSLSSGGFGDVYKVRAPSGAVAALKVRASYEQLLREVEPLEAIEHPNILKIIAYDKAADGSVFLVSEYLEGDTMEKHCARSFRLTDAEAVIALRSLLDALTAFHPNVTRLEELRATESLTAEEVDEVQRCRVGFIHRDIKPSNIIVTRDRGPVLIDFGIASRIAAPVKTISATPGYLPPDFDMSGWSPDVDLYQLGLTLLQARLGVHYDGSSNGIRELREVLRTERAVDDRLRGVLLGMTEPERSARFETAGAVMAALG